MKIIKKDGYRFNADWLKSVSLREAKDTLKAKPKELVVEVWNEANGKTKPKPASKSTTKKATSKSKESAKND